MNERVARLGILAVVVASLAAVLLATTRSEDVEGSWRRENYYVNYANYQRVGSGPLLETQNGDGAHPDDAFRVLVLGDSYSYGYGSPDLDARWPTRLEVELERRLGTGRTRVDMLVKPGAATVDQAAWLESYRRPYDVVVIGYTWNDLFPGEPVRAAWDGSGCPLRQDGGPGSLNIDGKVGFDCTVERLQGGSLDDVAAGYAAAPGRELAAAFSRIVAAADGRRVLALQLLTSQREFELQRVEPLMRDAGVTEIDPRPILDLIGSVGSGPGRFDLMVDPSDPHPSRVLADVYARLVADAVEPLVTGRRGGAVERPLVSNHLPHTMRGVATGERWELDLDPAALETVTYHEDGEALAPQYVPCMTINAPHARVMFDPFYERELSVTVDRDDLDLWTTGYDPTGRAVNRRIGPLKQGRPAMLRTGGDVSGVLIAARTSGCPTDRALTLPAMTVEITETTRATGDTTVDGDHRDGRTP